MPIESGGTRSRSGGMSVLLVSPDGRAVGGGVVGLLVTAIPVQVVVGSFLPCTQHGQKPKKQKTDSPQAATFSAAIPISSAEIEEGYGGQEHRNSGMPKPNLTSSPSLHGDNWLLCTPCRIQGTQTLTLTLLCPEGNYKGPN